MTGKPSSFMALDDTSRPHSFASEGGTLTVHPINHASIVLDTPAGLLFVDPVGDAARYSVFGTPDLIIFTHEHPDHLDVDVLIAIAGNSAPLVTNPGVAHKLPDALRARATVLSNGDSAQQLGIAIDAIPAYNTTEDRMKFHPQGIGNGYILTIGDMRIYISGDTEGIPDMRALGDIDLAFVCMNLPYTMDAAAAADAVSAFKPTYVYPYHYRGPDGGSQDPAEFAQMLADGITVKMGAWYD